MALDRWPPVIAIVSQKKMTYQFTDADRIWNRACFRECPNPRIGDQALASLLMFHSQAMNGGVLDTVEMLTPEDLSEAAKGYRFFGLDVVADFLVRAHNIFEAHKDFDKWERILNREYTTHVPADSFLVATFEKYLKGHPDEFEPVASPASDD